MGGALAKAMKNPEQDAALRKAFASYDSDGNGVLDPVELEKFGADLLKLVQKSVQGPMFDKIVYKTVLKLETPDNFLQLCMKKLDKDGDGQVTYDEFKEWISNTNTWANFKQILDGTDGSGGNAVGDGSEADMDLGGAEMDFSQLMDQAADRMLNADPEYVALKAKNDEFKSGKEAHGGDPLWQVVEMADERCVQGDAELNAELYKKVAWIDADYDAETARELLGKGANPNYLVPFDLRKGDNEWCGTAFQLLRKNKVHPYKKIKGVRELYREMVQKGARPDIGVQHVPGGAVGTMPEGTWWTEDAPAGKAKLFVQ